MAQLRFELSAAKNYIMFEDGKIRYKYNKPKRRYEVTFVDHQRNVISLYLNATEFNAIVQRGQRDLK